MSFQVNALRLAAKRDLLTFVELVFAALEPGSVFKGNWHYEHICWVLSRVMRGEVRRLIINVPPRSGKSIIASVAWPLFVVGHDPTKRVICVSHTEDLARKFSIDRRTVAQQPWYQDIFPDMHLAGPKPRDLELTTTSRGSILASGIGGSILGRGADVIIVDDPICQSAFKTDPISASNIGCDSHLMMFRDGLVLFQENQHHAGQLSDRILDPLRIDRRERDTCG